MSDFSSTPLQPQQNNFNKSQAFAAALQRAKQIAAKINPGGATDAGQKRPLDDIGQEPEAKKLAVHSPPRTNVLGGGGSAGVGAGGGMAPPGMGPVMGGPVSSEDIKVPDKMVGLIIGRGGEQITRLQSESGCKIQMAPDSGGMPDRICTLTGNAQAISRAKELVNAIVHQRYKTEGPGGGGGMHDMGAPPQQQHGGGGGGGGGGAGGSFDEVMIPGPKVGLVIGKGGETIKMLQEKSGAKMVVIQDGPNQEAEKPLRITGDPQKVQHARQLVYELLAEKEQFLQQRGGGGRGGGGGGRGGFGGGGRGGFNNRGGGEESTFVVPAAKCGVIIGRGGETIKQINQQSGAHCELDRRPNDNPNEKLFIIRGTPSQIEAAKQMISEKLGQAGSGGPGGPSNGQPGFGGPGGQGGQGGYPGQWAPPGPTAYHQPFHQQHMNPAMGMLAQNTAQPDYSQQWIEYYRSQNMHQEADAIEQQTKAKQAAAQGGAPVSQNPGPLAPASQPSAPTPQASAAAPQQNGAPDYSLQWAQYYRSVGKVKEAELIEAQIKNKQQGTPTAQPTGMVPQQSAAAAAPPVPSPYPAYQAPTPYPYQPTGYPAYGQPAGYQYSQVGVGGPQSAPGSQDQ